MNSRRVHKEVGMEKLDTVIAVFPDHDAAEHAIKTLAQAGFGLKSLSIIGHGYQREERVIGFYNVADRVTFWGGRGAFWGGLWGLFFSGVFIAAPVTGPVVVLGFLAGMAISALEGALIVGGFSALGASLYSLGIPKDSVIAYEAEVTADSFLVMVHGAQDEVAFAKAILGGANARHVEVHSDAGFRETKDRWAPLGA
jgi:hypothetical protein